LIIQGSTDVNNGVKKLSVHSQVNLRVDVTWHDHWLTFLHFEC
jgi:hypothetical protein